VDELTLNFILFAVLTPLIALNIVFLLPLMVRAERRGDRELRPLWAALFLCHFSSLLVALTLLLTLGAAKGFWSFNVDEFRPLWYLAAGAIVAETAAIAFWRWR
jgi:hypothetical protein